MLMQLFIIFTQNLCIKQPHLPSTKMLDAFVVADL